MSNSYRFSRNSWSTESNLYGDALPGTRRSDANTFSYNTASTRRRLDNDRNRARVAAADARARERRRAESDRRRAESDRRAGYARAGSFVSGVPDLLMSVVGIMLSLILIVHFFPVLFGENDMQKFFAGDEISVDRVYTLDGTPFYMFGASEKVDTIEAQGPDGRIHNMTLSMYGGDHFGMYDTYVWVDDLVDEFDKHISNPYAGSALFFWDFITDNFQAFVTGSFEDVGQDILDRINQAIGGFVDGFTEWWDKVLGKTPEGGT